MKSLKSWAKIKLSWGYPCNVLWVQSPKYWHMRHFGLSHIKQTELVSTISIHKRGKRYQCVSPAAGTCKNGFHLQVINQTRSYYDIFNFNSILMTHLRKISEVYRKLKHRGGSIWKPRCLEDWGPEDLANRQTSIRSLPSKYFAILVHTSSSYLNQNKLELWFNETINCKFYFIV